MTIGSEDELAELEVRISGLGAKAEEFYMGRKLAFALEGGSGTSTPNLDVDTTPEEQLAAARETVERYENREAEPS